MGHLESFGSRSSPREWILSFLNINTKTGSDNLYIFFCVSLPRPPFDYMVDFHRIKISKNKNHLMYQNRRKGVIIGYLCFKKLNFFYTHGCRSTVSDSAVTVLQSFWPCGTFQSHHIISRLNYPENWHNLCLRAPLLLVIYSLIFFPPHLTIAYILNFNFETGAAKH